MAKKKLKCVMCGATSGVGERFVLAKPLYEEGFKSEREVVCFSCYGLDYAYEGEDIDEVKE